MIKRLHKLAIMSKSQPDPTVWRGPVLEWKDGYLLADPHSQLNRLFHSEPIVIAHPVEDSAILRLVTRSLSPTLRHHREHPLFARQRVAREVDFPTWTFPLFNFHFHVLFLSRFPIT